jgi:dihydrolipoamide dehydrogenase
MAEVAVVDIIGVLDNVEQSGGMTADVMRYNAIPWAVYGIREAAGVGITEQEAAVKGVNIIKGSLPMRVSGRFVAENTLMGQGAVKVIADAENRRILGIHAVGAYAPEFIWGGAALIEQEFRIDEVKQLIFPHPTVCELIRDVVWEIGEGDTHA